MATHVAINSFGRICRLVPRTLLERYKKALAVVAINDMADLKTNAHLFRCDSSHGINLNRERGLNPVAYQSIAKGMLAPFGNPKILCPPQEAGLNGIYPGKIELGDGAILMVEKGF